MSAPLHSEDSVDAEDFVCCWLQPLTRAGVKRELADPWPFVLVQRVSGADDPEAGLDDPVIQLDIMHKLTTPASTAAGQLESVAKTWANKVHRRMTLLTTYPDVTVSTGGVAGVDYLQVLIRPHRQPFGDELVARYVARYRLGLSYVAAS